MFDAATLEAITQEARQAFLEEDAPECMAQLTQGYQVLEGVLTDASPQRHQLLKNMGRAAHSLKGGAGMAALTPLQILCHRLEDVFEALEQGRVGDGATAAGLVGLAIEEIQRLLDLAHMGQGMEGEEPPELALALEEFLTHCQPLPEDELAPVGDVSGFVRTSLTVELEACLERVERRLVRGGTPGELGESFGVLLEECVLLGQALGCDWLEQAGQKWRRVLADSPADLAESMATAIAEVRTLREQFLSGTLAPTEEAPAPPEVMENGNLAGESGDLSPSSPRPPTPTIPPSEETPPKRSRQTLRIPLDRLSRMSNTVSELLINQERLLEYDKQLRQASRNLKKRGQQLIPIREQVESLYDEMAFTDSFQGALNPTTVKGDSIQPGPLGNFLDFDALEMDRYSAVHGILQRFQELMVQVQEIQEDVDLVERELQETLIQTNQSLRQLDNDLTQSRLVPFQSLARSFAQPLAQLGDRHGKPVQLVIQGENTLVEVAILEQLRTPLTHLLRNGFDHGLEFPGDRQRQGKSPQGTLTLKAETAHNQVIITVADDGRGVDTVKIRDKAIALGLTTPEKATQASPQQLLNYLFQPGFSTASQVSDLSGRGLGLDIVKQIVESLRGTLHLETQPGQGSQFIIRIPLTLNIVPLLLVRVYQRLLAFPSENILRILALEDYPVTNGRIQYQSQSLPVRPLAELLPDSPPSGDRHTSANKVGLIVQLGDYTVVLSVEKIVDERPLVVKTLDAITPIPSYVAGCTLLGTGEVVPVLIPNNLAGLWRTQPTLPTDRPTVAGDQITLLIVDDSVTVRRTLQRVLIPAGFNLIQCRDGQEAWELLNRQSQGIDLALCDIEMPTMDGFTLLQLVRAHQAWRHLPIVMLTSRENPLHRNRAMALGATGYLTKPFQPQQLVSSLRDFLSKTTQPNA